MIYAKPLPLRLGWRQHWLVLLEQPVHLQVRPALAAAFLGAAPRHVGRGRCGPAHTNGVAALFTNERFATVKLRLVAGRFI